MKQILFALSVSVTLCWILGKLMISCGCELDKVDNTEALLRLPTKFDVPADLDSWGIDENSRETSHQSIYERFYLAAWNDCLERLGHADFATSDVMLELENGHKSSPTSVLAISEIPIAERGIKDGIAACIKMFNMAVEAKGISVARKQARDCNIRIASINGILCDRLAAPSQVTIPKSLDSYVVYRGLHGEPDALLMPRAHYRMQYALRWNEVLYNFGIRRLPIQQCDESFTNVLARPKQEQIGSVEEACDACMRRISILRQVVPDDELRIRAENSISQETRKYLDSFPIVRDE